MNYYAEIKSGNVSSILETRSVMVGAEFIAIDSNDTTLLGASYDDETGEFTRPQAQTHKTKGLNQTEYRGLYSVAETIKIDELEAYINDMTYQVSGGAVGLDDDAALAGVAGATYRQLMRSGFAAFAKSTVSGVDMDNPTTLLSVNCQDLLGLLDSPARKDVIKLGVPL